MISIDRITPIPLANLPLTCLGDLHLPPTFITDVHVKSTRTTLNRISSQSGPCPGQWLENAGYYRHLENYTGH